MSNIIYADFDKEDDNSGYVLENKSVVGVYVGNIGAISEEEGVYLGTKEDDGLSYPTLNTMEEMNQFCIMWLCIFQPEVIVEDKEE